MFKCFYDDIIEPNINNGKFVNHLIIMSIFKKYLLLFLTSKKLEFRNVFLSNIFFIFYSGTSIFQKAFFFIFLFFFLLKF